MPPPSASTGLTITNPLVLYRALLATKRIDPDPAQHRLAIHLQKLYHRLKDYEPQIEYSRRISQLSNALGNTAAAGPSRDPGRQNGILGAIAAQRATTATLALTRRLTDHESALQMTSPQGLLLYGEVGTGKSMLVDLLADCLPTRKKRRWHFHTFMLEIFARLEHFRRAQQQLLLRSGAGSHGHEDEHSVLWLAREMIATSPILFLDEFQLPDRAASKILAHLMTAFFHLGGVLVATSNRMPEELARASGIELARPPSSALGMLGDRWNIFGQRARGRSESMFSGPSDFAAFLEVLRARCEVWDMEGNKDWRRREMEDGDEWVTTADTEPLLVGVGSLSASGARADEKAGAGQPPARESPRYYFVVDPSSELHLQEKQKNAFQVALAQALKLPLHSPDPLDVPWEPTSLQIYGRTVVVPQTWTGIAKWSFSSLCGSAFGPADYITFASTFHTFLITDVPVLTAPLKNEARRFITLLDALYESRCKLLISAAAAPDGLFFPDVDAGMSSSSAPPELVDDATLAETFSELYQDRTAPFRPNITAYTPSSSPPAYASPSTSPFLRRSILADEDSDFGPLVPPSSSSTTFSSSSSPSHHSQRRGSSDGPPGAGHEIGSPSLDFRRADLFTGEDERFAYKRARSRLWELCGRRWWARDGDDWWRPVRMDVRRWEGGGGSMLDAALGIALDAAPAMGDLALQDGKRESGEGWREDCAGVGGGGGGGGEKEGGGREGRKPAPPPPISSPFRTSTEPPPTIAWVHAWGMMRWGKKAGEWGKGVDGLRGKGKGKGEGKNR